MSTKVKVVNIDGEITLPHAESVAQTIQKALDEKPMVLLSLSQARDIDLAGIQVIYAARRYAQKKDRSFHITGAVPETIARRLHQAGFSHGIYLDGRDLDARLVEFGSSEVSHA